MSTKNKIKISYLKNEPIDLILFDVKEEKQPRLYEQSKDKNPFQKSKVLQIEAEPNIKEHKKKTHLTFSLQKLRNDIKGRKDEDREKQNNLFWNKRMEYKKAQTHTNFFDLRNLYTVNTVTNPFKRQNKNPMFELDSIKKKMDTCNRNIEQNRIKNNMKRLIDEKGIKSKLGDLHTHEDKIDILTSESNKMMARLHTNLLSQFNTNYNTNFTTNGNTHPERIYNEEEPNKINSDIYSRNYSDEENDSLSFKREFSNTRDKVKQKLLPIESIRSDVIKIQNNESNVSSEDDDEVTESSNLNTFTNFKLKKTTNQNFNPVMNKTDTQNGFHHISPKRIRRSIAMNERESFAFNFNVNHNKTKSESLKPKKDKSMSVKSKKEKNKTEFQTEDNYTKEYAKEFRRTLNRIEKEKNRHLSNGVFYPLHIIDIFEGKKEIEIEKLKKKYFLKKPLHILATSEKNKTSQFDKLKKLDHAFECLLDMNKI